MAIQAFAGIQSIGAASQPVFGTTMSGVGVMTTDPHTRSTGPASQPSTTVLPLTSTAGFKVGQRVAVGPKANFVYQGTIDKGTVTAVVAGTSITVEGLITTHASGEYVVLAEDCNRVVVEPLTTTNPKYLGTASTVAVGDASTFFVLDPAAGLGLVYDSGWAPANSSNTSDYWIQGTTADTFVAHYAQV